MEFQKNIDSIFKIIVNSMVEKKSHPIFLDPTHKNQLKCNEKQNILSNFLS